jgi:hypothetical protein
VAIDVEKATALLEEIRRDPYGVDWMDLDKLLTLWGFERESLETAKGWEVWHRYHPQHPELDVVLWPRRSVHSKVTQRVLEVVDRLRNELGLTA